MPGWGFNIAFEANDLSTREALAAMRSSLQSDGFDADLTGRIEMVMAELFNNIAEHAYANAGFGLVAVKMRQDQAGVAVRVTDQGLPMPGGLLPEGRLPDTDVALIDLPEGGFGWQIIKSQTDNLSYKRIGRENCTCLRFDCETPHAAPEAENGDTS